MNTAFHYRIPSSPQTMKPIHSTILRLSWKAETASLPVPQLALGTVAVRALRLYHPRTIHFEFYAQLSKACSAGLSLFAQCWRKKMRKAVGLLVATAFVLVSAIVVLNPGLAKATGNGAPNGAHYDLNIIGVTNGKNPPLTGSDRHTIFVPLYTNGRNGADMDPVPGTDIFLTQGPFAVCDGNAFDAAYDCSGTQIAKQGAVFQLPCDTLTTAASGTTLVPCTTGASAAYEVWARVVGTPGGSATSTTCATDSTGTLVCSAQSEVFVRMKPNKFTNVTDALTSLVTSTQTIALFQDQFQGFFWDYDNNGNKVLQLRFYLVQ